MTGARGFRLAVAGLALAGLAACDLNTAAPRSTAVTPQPRPAAVAPPPAPTPAEPAGPSAESRALADYYARLQADLLAQGLMRVDGGGIDTPFTDTVLVNNFERIALAEEYVRGAGLTPGNDFSGRIKKWTRPIRFEVEFGNAVSQDQRATDRANVARYVNRLSRLTGHPMSMQTRDANFHVLFMGTDDSDLMVNRILALVPNINSRSLAVFQNLPREIHCLVIAFADDPGGYAYGKAIAVIRAEHPDLMRQSCIHEELAQGLGLGNDSPVARPSIFNDDDEFALLTTHDEMLLAMLYDPRLRPGMGPDEALPIARLRAATLTGTGGPS